MCKLVKFFRLENVPWKSIKDITVCAVSFCKTFLHDTDDYFIGNESACFHESLSLEANRCFVLNCCTQNAAPDPVGEYPMSCLARERAFEYAAKTYGTSVCIMRLNYAIDLRYGVLHDIAQTILAGKPVDLSAMPSFNCIWQKDANEAAIRLLLHTSPDMSIVNVTGPETAGVKRTAELLAKGLNKPVTFVGQEASTAYLNNAGKMFTLFGYPTASLDTLIDWQCQWLNAGGRSLGKPTHFEERNGKY